MACLILIGGCYFLQTQTAPAAIRPWRFNPNFALPICLPMNRPARLPHWSGLLPLVLLLTACPGNKTEPPEPAGIVNAYGTSAADYCQQLVAQGGDQLLVLASSEVNGPPALLGLRLEASGYSPSGSLSSLPEGIQGRFLTFGAQQRNGELWTGLASGNRFLAAGRLEGNGSLPNVAGLLLDPEQVSRNRFQCHGRALVAGPASDWLIAGHVFDDTRTDDLLAVRFGRDGSPVWTKAWGTPQNEYLTDATSDGAEGLVAVGFDTRGQLLAVQISSTGQLVQAQALSLTGWQLSSPRIAASNGNYVVLAQASTDPGPRQAALLLELNASLNPVRSRLLIAEGRLKPRVLAPLGEGWAVAGAFEGAALDRGTDAFWFQLGADWSPRVGTAFGGTGIDEASALAPTERGGTWLGGSTESFDPSADLFIVRLNDRHEARCQQRNLDFRTEDVSLAAVTPTLTERMLTYFQLGRYSLTVRTDLARNRPTSSQPCRN